MFKRFLDKFREVLVILTFIFAGTGLYLIYDKTKDMQASPIIVNKCSGEDADNSMLKIDVEGAVTKPGLITLKQGSIYNDAIKEVGGYSKLADIVYVNKNYNMASKLTDGQKIYIPSISENSNAASSASTNASVSSNKININTASESDLDTLPGIGPTYAKRIIDGRPYSSIDEIKNIQGISESTFEKIKELISI